jgi:TrmH RNA methyltransferase
LEFVELYRSIRFAHTLQQLRQSYRVIGTAAETGQPIDALHRAGRPFALVIGNEEHGLPRATA